MSAANPYPGGLCRRQNTCIYRAIYGYAGSHCSYFAKTGKLRGCPADQCDKYEPKPRKRKQKEAVQK